MILLEGPEQNYEKPHSVLDSVPIENLTRFLKNLVSVTLFRDKFLCNEFLTSPQAIYLI
jgi:hypothetical protein